MTRTTIDKNAARHQHSIESKSRRRQEAELFGYLLAPPGRQVPSKGSLALILPSRAEPLPLTGPRMAMPFDGT